MVPLPIKTCLPRSGAAAALAALALAAACPDPGHWFGAPAARAAEEAERVFDLKIVNGKVAGGVDTVRVKHGETVRLRWRADAPTVLHLHGYDIEKKVVPGAVAEFRFKAHATGRFPVNVHGHGHGGGHHETALIYLEVFPR